VSKTSSIPRALGQPNLLEVASPFLGALSVAVSGLLSLAVLLALVLLVRDARLVPTSGNRAGSSREGGEP
jgi:hypothetical protein